MKIIMNEIEKGNVTLISKILSCQSIFQSINIRKKLEIKNKT